MSEFKVGDKVRVLRVNGVPNRAAEVPYESVIVDRYKDSAHWYVHRRGPGTEKLWMVGEHDLELIEEPTPTIGWYPGFEDDVRLLASDVWKYRNNKEAARRLLEALTPPEPPKCGKVLRQSIGSRIALYPGDGSHIWLICNLAAGHDGPHAPDIPEEAWQ